MKKLFSRICILTVVLILSIATISYAASGRSGSFSDGAKRFSPNSGTLEMTVNSSQGRVKTILTVEYSEERAFDIWADSYNAEYAGIDVKEDPSQDLHDVMDAYSVVTTLPDAKTDIENSAGNSYSDESEAVALGRIEGNKEYTMTTIWHDYRDTQSKGLSGQFNANSEQSARGLGDYNVIPGQWESLTQIQFGDVKGKY